MTIENFRKHQKFPLKILEEDYLWNFNFEELREPPGFGKSFYGHVDLRLYVKSQWERVSNQPSGAYLAYRWFHLVVLFLCLALSLASCPQDYALKCYIYMTTWAQCFHLYQAAVGAAIVTITYRTPTVAQEKPVPAQLLTLYGAHHATSVALALGVSFVYWSFIYEPGVQHLTMAKIISHGVNSVVMLLDLLLVAHPVVLWDIVYPLSLGLVYTFFTILYYSLGGTNAGGDPYVYKILDWSQPMDALSFVIIGMCILSFTFLLVWLMATLRISFANRLKPVYTIVQI